MEFWEADKLKHVELLKRHLFQHQELYQDRQNKSFVCLTGIGHNGRTHSHRQISISSDKDLLIPVFVASYSSVELPGRSNRKYLS